MISGYKIDIEDGCHIDMKRGPSAGRIWLGLPQEGYSQNLYYELTLDQARNLVVNLESMIKELSKYYE